MQYSADEAKKRIADAEKTYKKAVDLTKTSFFAMRFEPDYEMSARLAKTAITDLRRCGTAGLDALIKTLVLSADNNERLDLLNYAAGDYDECATACENRIAAATSGQLPLAENLKKELEDRCLECLSLSSKAYVRNNQIDRGASIALKGAKAATRMNRPDFCATFYESAFEIYEREQKPSTSETACNEAIAYYVDLANYEKALDLLNRQNALFRLRMDMFESDLCKNYLSIAVLMMLLKRYTELREELQRWENDVSMSFGTHRECAAAHALLNAMGENDEAVEAARKSHPVLRVIQIPLARAAKLIKADPAAVNASAAEFTTTVLENATAGEGGLDAFLNNDDEDVQEEEFDLNGEKIVKPKKITILESPDDLM